MSTINKFVFDKKILTMRACNSAWIECWPSKPKVEGSNPSKLVK